jgi:NAD+ synthase (glutamine-hydrolysing)
MLLAPQKWKLLAILFLFSFMAQAKAPLKVAMLQFDPIAGDFEYNLSKIREGYLRAVADGADILITPELADVGYSYGDYLERPEVWGQAAYVAEELRKLTEGKETALLLGHLVPSAASYGKPIQNVASAYVNGELVHRHAKMLLPDYDVFNDARWFHPGRKTSAWHFKGYKIGVAICEDWWYEDKFQGFQGERHYYHHAKNPVKTFKKEGIDLAISLSASPYGRNKQAYREKVHAEVARELKVPFLWNGMSGATDAVIYDGRSFVLNEKGETLERLNMFAPDYGLVSFPEGLGPNSRVEVSKDSAGIDTNPREEEVVLQALLSGIREYIRRTGQKGFVLGISGGIDSALVAALISMAIGPENLITVSLPTEYNSEGSKTDAFQLVRALGVPENNIDMLAIQEVYEAAAKLFGAKFWQEGGTIDENTQARIRMLVLNGIANRFPGYTVAVTGNKTEYAMGYFTFGGDDKGGLGILGGLWKSEVYALSRYINERAGREVIPWNSINKPASAELKHEQVSYGSPTGMPPYEILDPLLRDYFEYRIPLSVLVNSYTGFLPQRGTDWVTKVIRHAENMDYKRRQAAPLLRVDARKTFDWIGRRVPVAKRNLHAPNIVPCEGSLIERPIPNVIWFPNSLTNTLLGKKAV